MSILQDTVQQFEKVITLERSLLRESIQKLGIELEEVSAVIEQKEEESILWEERIVQVRKDNVLKLQLVRARLCGDRGHRGRRGPVEASEDLRLDLIAEGSGGEEEEEDEDEEYRGDKAHDAAPSAASTSTAAKVEATNSLASAVVEEVAQLRRLWEELNQALPSLPGAGASPALARMPLSGLLPKALGKAMPVPISRPVLMTHAAMPRWEPSLGFAPQSTVSSATPPGPRVLRQLPSSSAGHMIPSKIYSPPPSMATPVGFRTSGVTYSSNTAPMQYSAPPASGYAVAPTSHYGASWPMGIGGIPRQGAVLTPTVQRVLR